ncbi:low molecular weight protein-tyrosine-phosphatase [Rhizohabitans arisaemae]|uniref:low molecular weight protein-tyrosine-phosphatase n=1 Tax=Rhizohabitans arisaemae TaxID=2720610 RepID=UPI0024B18BEA|nr:low molecular weight protein-tyrosine-phosphatase [Rhizohabitans arisaemae]
MTALALPPPRDPALPYTICMVCLGNICRSPTAEVVLRAELDRRGLGDLVVVDSAGTGGWHVGGPMDARSSRALAARGYPTAHRARQFTADWIGRRDLVLAMDGENLSRLHRLGGTPDRVRLFRSFDPSAPPSAEVPDPYYGGRQGFEGVLDMCERAAKGLADLLANGSASDAQ